MVSMSPFTGERWPKTKRVNCLSLGTKQLPQAFLKSSVYRVSGHLARSSPKRGLYSITFRFQEFSKRSETYDQPISNFLVNSAREASSFSSSEYYSIRYSICKTNSDHVKLHTWLSDLELVDYLYGECPAAKYLL